MPASSTALCYDTCLDQLLPIGQFFGIDSLHCVSRSPHLAAAAPPPPRAAMVYVSKAKKEAEAKRYFNPATLKPYNRFNLFFIVSSADIQKEKRTTYNVVLALISHRIPSSSESLYFNQTRTTSRLPRIRVLSSLAMKM